MGSADVKKQVYRWQESVFLVIIGCWSAWYGTVGIVLAFNRGVESLCVVCDNFESGGWGVCVSHGSEGETSQRYCITYLLPVMSPKG